MPLLLITPWQSAAGTSARRSIGVRAFLRCTVVGTLLWTAATTVGCGGASADDPPVGEETMAPPGADGSPTPLGPDLALEPRWTSDPAAQFTYVTDLDVDAAGRVFVADASQLTITVLGPDGRRLRTIGRSGAGPGEFRGIGSVQVGPNDTLFVFDNNLQRLTAFRPVDDSVVYTRFVGEQASGAPERAYRIGPDPRIVATYMTPVHARASDAQFAERRLVVRLLDDSGTVKRDSMVVGIGRSNLFRRAGSMISVGTNAFGRQPVARISPRGTIFYARTDTIAVSATALDGDVERRCELLVDRVAVKPEDLRREQELTSPRLRDVLTDSMPETWPPMVDFVVDEADGAWIGLTGPGGVADRWAWCDSSGALRGSIRLPRSGSVVAVRGHLLYAVVKDDDQVPFIHAFRIQNDPHQRAP